MKKLLNLLALPLLLLGGELSAQCNLTGVDISAYNQCLQNPGLSARVDFVPGSVGTGIQFLWSDGQTGGNIQIPNTTQSYTVTVSDPAVPGCSVVSPAFAFVVAPRVQVTITVQSTACSGLGGEAIANVTGGLPPYRYQWGNGETTQQAVALTNGTAYCRVYDSRNDYFCSDSAFAQVGGIATYGIYANPSSCSQTATNGSIQLYTQNPNYTYLWTNGATTQNLTGVGQGLYQVTISDPTLGNCSITQQAMVGYRSDCETIFSGYMTNSTNCTQGTNNYFGYVGLFLRNSNGNYNGYWGAYNYQNSGYYEIRTINPGSYTIEPYISIYSGLTTSCPAAGSYPVTATANGGYVSGKDFTFSYPNANNVKVDFWSRGIVAGFEYEQYINYCNHGQNAVANGSISISYNSNQLSYVSISAYPSWYWWSANSNGNTTFGSNANGVLVLNYANLASGECRAVHTEFLSNQTLTLGSTVTVTANIDPLMGDAVPADNQYVGVHVVRSSYDPNDKQMLNFKTGNSFVGTILPTQNTMEYLIRFQNTGTAAARRVVVRDLLPSFLERNTIRNIQTSHASQIRTEGQEMIFVFDGINLPDSFTNEAASHGFIKFTIDRVAGLPLGTQINNSASIYFDFNAPVITNTNQMTIQNLAVAVEEARKIDMRVMPNPFRDVFTVQYELETETDVRINLYNALGEAVGAFQNTQNQAAGAHQIQVPTQDLANGIYWLQIETKNGRYAQKIIKQ